MKTLPVIFSQRELLFFLSSQRDQTSELSVQTNLSLADLAIFNFFVNKIPLHKVPQEYRS